MQTLDFVSGLHDCLEFSQPLSCLYQAMQILLNGKPWKRDWMAKVFFLIQMLPAFGGRCNRYFWDIYMRLKILRLPSFKKVLRWSVFVNLVPRVFSLSNMAAAGEKTPTSSPGSSHFPIWRRQERRPWHGPWHTVVPKSYRPKGQPRSTRNEFPIRADFGNSRKHPIWRLKRGENWQPKEPFYRQRSVIYGIVDEVCVYCDFCRVLGPVY